MLDTSKALKQASRLNRINITQGTKGGRGKGQDRWVPVNPQALETLKQAKALQGKDKNLIPNNKTYVQWRDHAYYQWRIANQNAHADIKGFHDMRAAFACERYQEITGYPAPVINGQRQAPKVHRYPSKTNPLPDARPQQNRCNSSLYWLVQITCDQLISNKRCSIWSICLTARYLEADEPKLESIPREPNE